MCNRYRVTANQIELAEKYGIVFEKLMPEPEPLPPPELFAKRPGWSVRKHQGQIELEAMS